MPGDAPAPTTLEGRPAPAQASPLQVRIDAAQPGDRIEIAAGTYTGDLYIDKAVTLVGTGRPVLRGSGSGSVVRVRAAGVTLEGLDIDGGGAGDLGRDTSGIHVAAPRVTIRDVRVRQALFGIYLRESDDAVIEGSRIAGIPDRDPGEVGSGIHIWNSQRFHLDDIEIVGTRDGIYVQSSSHGTVRQHAGPGPALRSALHVLRRQPVRGQHLRERRGRRGADVLGAHHLPPQSLRAQPRLRVGGPAAEGVRRGGGRGQPDCRQRAGHLSRGLVPQPVPPQRGGPLGHGARHLRLERRERVRGQLVRRQPDAAVAVGQAHRHAHRGQLLVGPRAARPGRRRHRRPPVPPVERVRPRARQPHRRRPLLARHRRGGAGRRRARVPGARPHPRDRPAPVDATAGARPRPVGSSAAPSTVPLRAPACPGCSSSQAAACSPRAVAASPVHGGAALQRRPHANDPLPRLHQGIRRAPRRRRPYVRRAARIGGGAAWPQRIGQDHLHQGRRRPRATHFGRGAAGRRGRERPRRRGRGTPCRSCRSGCRSPSR